MIDKINEAKIDRLLDMISRAVAQEDRVTSFRKIAEAIAKDWNPMIAVDKKGRVSVSIRATGGE